MRVCVRVCVRECHLKAYIKIRSKCKKYSISAKPEVCNADINKDAFAKMVEESLLNANSVEAIWSKCDFKDSTFRTWKKRTPNVWPKEARGKWSLQIAADLPLEPANQCVTRDTLKINLRSALKVGVAMQCLTLSHIVMYWHADRFCGRIIAWGPKFHEVKYRTDPKDFDNLMIKNSEYLISGLLSTGDNFDDAVRCLPVCHFMLLSYARPLQMFDLNAYK